MTHETRSPLIIGHRGAPGYRPEHTESCYRLAVDLGADAVEPDVVATKDGVLVVRHENEISTTTDVASRSEFADRYTTKMIDGISHSGWFTEDFTWQEIQTLRAKERLRKLRADNTQYDGKEPVLRLAQVLEIVDEQAQRLGKRVHVVVELKHAAYFESIGLPLVSLLQRELTLAGWQDRAEDLTYECFELGILDELRSLGTSSTRIFLLESRGAPADEVLHNPDTANTFAWYRSEVGVRSLRGRVDGISVAKRDLYEYGALGIAKRTNDLVSRAHQEELLIYTWTLRPENAFLGQRYRIGSHPAAWGNWQGEMSEIFELGVDGVFLDHPDLGVSLDQHRLEVT